MFRKNKRIFGLLVVLILMVGLFFGYEEKGITIYNNLNNTISNSKPNTNTNENNLLQVHYINVGQGDSILVTEGQHSMLIDAGENDKGDTVVNYLKSVGINKLDIIVGTHPDSDHIGGLDTVMNSIDFDQVYMPNITKNTKTFEDVVKAISRKNKKITAPISNTVFELGDANVTILAPNSIKYDDSNNYSIVLKLQYGSKKFLFMGDSENISEEEMLNKDYDLSANVLKVGHHGSNSSTTKDFLNEVNPQYAIIEVGADNEYGHPTEPTLTKLQNKNIKVYRTDLNGNIICTTDGEKLEFKTNK